MVKWIKVEVNVNQNCIKYLVIKKVEWNGKYWECSLYKRVHLYISHSDLLLFLIIYFFLFLIIKINLLTINLLTKKKYT